MIGAERSAVLSELHEVRAVRIKDLGELTCSKINKVFEDICHLPRPDRSIAQHTMQRFTCPGAALSSLGVRRDKAALSSGCKSHPATAPAGSNRSSHGGDEVAEASG